MGCAVAVLVLLLVLGIANGSGGLVCFSITMLILLGIGFSKKRDDSDEETPVPITPIPPAIPRPVPKAQPLATRFEPFDCRNCGAQNPGGVADDPVCAFCGSFAHPDHDDSGDGDVRPPRRNRP